MQPVHHSERRHRNVQHESSLPEEKCRLLPLITAILFLLGSAYAQTVSRPVTSQLPGHNAILLGTDWYPEQWPESRWEEDLRLMRWAIDFQRHTTKYDQISLLRNYYHDLRPLAQSIDVISPEAPLQDYKLVVAPSLNVIPETLAQRLLEYVRNGGHLVLGPRSGMKDEYNALLPQRQPGFMADALGGRVDQYYAIEKDFPVSGEWGEGQVTIYGRSN